MFLTFFSLNAKSIDKKHFYEVFKGESIVSIESLLSVYEKIKNPEAEVLLYKGALYVKKSGFLKNANEKIEFFKKGREIIEKKIIEQPDNVEFRFVRLIVQEEVPTILRYYTNKEEDAKIVIEGTSRLEKVVQDAIFDYSKKTSYLTFD